MMNHYKREDETRSGTDKVREGSMPNKVQTRRQSPRLEFSRPQPKVPDRHASTLVHTCPTANQ